MYSNDDRIVVTLDAGGTNLVFGAMQGGEKVGRVQMKVYDLDNDDEFAAFAKGDAHPLKVYGYDDTVTYDPQKSTGVIVSKLGANKAISVGAYCFALSSVDNK